MEFQSSTIECLYERYSRFLLKFAYKQTTDTYLAEDAVSLTFEKVMKNINKLEITSESYTCALLMLMCKRAIIDLSKQKIRAIGIPLADPPDGSTDTDEVINEVLQQNSREEIERILCWLPNKYLEPFLMHHLDGLSVSEISQKTGVSHEAVRSRLRRAKGKLQEQYRQNGGRLF